MGQAPRTAHARTREPRAQVTLPRDGRRAGAVHELQGERQGPPVAQRLAHRRGHLLGRGGQRAHLRGVRGGMQVSL